MNLKNYTSEVPASTSLSRIEKNLVEAGVTDISKKYEAGVCIAVTFRMTVNTIPVFFKLPARVDACFKVLWAEIKKPISGTRERVKSQAERTAWKIISDWVEVQISMVTLEQAEMMQVFLPFIYNPEKEETFYEQIKESGYKALLT